MMLRWLLAVLLCSGAAFAQGKPTLIDYPLDVKAALKEVQSTELQNDFRQLLARTPAVLLSTRSHWKASFSALKRSDCELRDECLQQLATTAGTLYALYASVEQNAAGTEVTATGRIVNQDGVQTRARATFTAAKKGPFTEAAREALRQLITGLELEKLPAVLTKPVVAAAPVAPVVVEDAPLKRQPEDLVLVVPALPPEVIRQEPGVPPVRVGAWVTGGLGLAAAGVAVGFGLSAAMARTTLPLDGRFDEAQASTQAAVNRDASVALGASLGAAALLGTAAVLFVTSAPPSAPVISLVPAPGGAQLTLTGAFSP